MYIYIYNVAKQFPEHPVDLEKMEKDKEVIDFDLFFWT